MQAAILAQPNLEVIEGEVDPQSGWLIDFDAIDAIWAPLHEQIDHRYLNEVPGLENPTSENLARWIWARLKPELPGLSRIVVRETPNAGCSYEGK